MYAIKSELLVKQRIKNIHRQESRIQVKLINLGVEEACYEKLSTKEQVVVKLTSARVKQQRAGKSLYKSVAGMTIPLMPWTRDMLSASRDVSLNAMVATETLQENGTLDEAGMLIQRLHPLSFSARQTRLADIKQPEEATARDLQLIDVVNSVLSVECLSTGHPEVMPETDGDQCAVTISFGEPVEAKKQSRPASSIILMEPMESRAIRTWHFVRRWKQTKSVF